MTARLKHGVDKFKLKSDRTFNMIEGQQISALIDFRGV